jgi:diaminopimelate epimerase
MENFFVKSHGLGNEYVVLDKAHIDFGLTEESIQTICNVHFGIGSDGILVKMPSENADFGLKIFNPDGSEAEKSGNGLRIFSKYLYDYKYADKKEFTIETLGGIVKASIVDINNNGKASMVQVDMGKAIFKSADIPVICDKEECLGEELEILNKSYSINCVSVGNPHCVILKDKLNESEIRKYGALIETNSIFPNRINVQFAKVVSRKEIEIVIWERGAGYTLASGSSSCAVAAVVVKKDLTDRNITLKMPGGELEIEIDEMWNIKMTGEVKEIVSGTFSNELIDLL